jgi:phosphatidate cytidylyltransferase
VNNFLSRIITGSLVVAILISGIIINKYSFMVVFLALLIACIYEFYSIFEKAGKSPQKFTGIILGILIFAINYILATGYTKPQQIIITILPVVLYIVIAELFRKHATPFENIAITVFGIIYIALPISLFWYLAYKANIYQYNYHLILGFFLLIWVYDSMAYVVGMALGKRKLFERISPKKSWEGAIGGLIFALGVAFLLSYFFKNDHDLTTIQWLIFAFLVAVFGTFGDLAESMLKRSLDIKDSGTLLPGHGGFLDRFDAVFLAIPAVYIYLQFV